MRLPPRACTNSTTTGSTIKGLAALLLVFLSCPVTASAAELKPPLEALRDPNYTLIVAERLDRPVTNDRMFVRVIERLRGDLEVPDEIDLLVQHGDGERVAVGEQYLLFYSDVERVNFRPRKEVRRPDRRKLLHIDGAAPAVFPDTAAMRALFDAAHAEVEASAEFHDMVMAGLASDDPAMVDLWSAEWALRPRSFHFHTVRPDDVGLLSGIVEDPHQRPAARARLLEIGAERTPPENGQWYVASAGLVLGQLTPAQLTESAGLSSLIYASLHIAQENPDAAVASQLETWLRASPPLAENAALALRAIEPELERKAVRAAIADEGTPQQTRSFLADHMRRLELADRKASERRAGDQQQEKTP